MSFASQRRRAALHGYAPGSDPSKTTTCVDPLTGRKYSTPQGSVLNNGGNMKFGLYPTVGVSVGFLNLLSNCCANNQTGGITSLAKNGCTTK